MNEEMRRREEDREVIEKELSLVGEEEGMKIWDGWKNVSRNEKENGMKEGGMRGRKQEEGENGRREKCKGKRKDVKDTCREEEEGEEGLWGRKGRRKTKKMEKIQQSWEESL